MTNGRAPTDPRPPEAGRPSRRFAFGLLAYLVLTLLVFRLVSRYAIRVAALYNYDIEPAGLQFGLYFLIYAVLTLLAVLAMRWAPVILLAGGGRAVAARLTRENQLRLAFLGGTALSLAAAVYQSRFAPVNLVNFFVVGTLGAFATALWVTRREFRLVEVIARPPALLVAEVEAGHRGVVVATSGWDRTKRSLEVVLASAAILVSLPISLPLAMAVWLQDPGPLLVAKVAVMRGGRSFHQLKLRSMVKDAEGATGPVPAAPDDQRVTVLGGLLRRTHIDELPQMLNIARGEMSFVGPRPERTVFVHRHLRQIPGYAGRHAVRPGLAGMAQVFGDYYSTPAQKLRYDLLYIRRRSLALDLKLFGAAVLIGLFGVQPARRRRRRHRDESARWRRAYEALRGESAPGPPPSPEE